MQQARADHPDPPPPAPSPAPPPLPPLLLVGGKARGGAAPPPLRELIEALRGEWRL